MDAFVETLLVLVYLAVIAWRSRELLGQLLPVLASPKRLVDFLTFFWRGRRRWFSKGAAVTVHEDAPASPAPAEPTKKTSGWLELARAVAGYAVAFLGAGLLINDGGNKVVGVILLAAAIVVIPSKWYS